MIAMIFAALTMLLLAWGAITEVPFALGFGIFLLAFTMLLEFIGGILIIVYGVEESDVLTSDLKEVFFKLIYRMDYDSRANRILKIVQEYVSLQLKGARFVLSARASADNNKHNHFRSNAAVQMVARIILQP